MGKARKAAVYLIFGWLLMILGMSDALRGVFAPIFEEHYGLGNVALSMIVTVSYAGNLFFLLCGGRIADAFGKKRVTAVILMFWMAALLLYLTTDRYSLLLAGMFFSMGASTLVSTMINIMTPMVFPSAPVTAVNSLFFIQGIGTTGGQKLVGMFAKDIGSWKLVSLGLLLAGAVGLISFILAVPSFAEDAPKKNVPKEAPADGGASGGRSVYKTIFRSPAFWCFTLIFGFYFIAEHGLQNWIVTYCVRQYGYTIERGSTYLAAFYGLITVGRLVFSPLIQRLGTLRTVGIFGSVAAVLYTAGFFMDARGLLLISLSGIFYSILYPSILLLVQNYFESRVVATAVGTILSAGTLFDVGFNGIFGKCIDIFGFEQAFFILPASLILCMAVYFAFTRSSAGRKTHPSS